MPKQPSRKPFAEHRDHHQEVTDRIIAALEGGTKPWQQPWSRDAAARPLAPMNPTTGRKYHGINTLVLAMSAFAMGGDPRFCSYKQAGDRGWQVKRGERGTTVFFFKRMEVDGPRCPARGGGPHEARPLAPGVHRVQRRATWRASRPTWHLPPPRHLGAGRRRPT